MADHLSPLEYVLGLARIVVWVVGVIWMGRSVIRPDPDEHLRWYDRLLRAVGVLIVGTLLLFGIPRWLGWVK